MALLQLGAAFGGPGPPGTTVPAKKTEFSLWTRLPPLPQPDLASIQTQGQISFLLQELSSFQGEGPFAMFRAVILQGDLARPNHGPGTAGQSGD